jgi:hypothetical protein
MGCDILAFLLLDDKRCPDEPPFTNGWSTWDLTNDRIMGCKDYDFYAAIAGIRNRFGKAPLIQPRGLPPHDQVDRIARLSRGYSGVSWLTLSEIEAAMCHMGIEESKRAEQVQRLLEVIRAMERRIGRDRVRLVFGFAD